MAEPLAQVADVESRWRPLTADETPVATTLLDDASAYLRVKVPTVDADITAATLDATLVAGVVARMVIRIMRNPTGAIAKTRSVDDFSESETYDREAVKAEMWVPDTDLALLVPSETGGAFTIRPAYVDPTTGTWAATS